MSEKVTPGVTNSFALQCEGVGKFEIAPLADNPVQITVTIYGDGAREVGCAYLDKDTGACMATRRRAAMPPCIQLFPGRVEAVSDKPEASGSADVSNATEEKISTQVSDSPHVTATPRGTSVQKNNEYEWLNRVQDLMDNDIFATLDMKS